ncbi:hypothetical protein BDZ89DRAFT_250297 [Hymenopellis radicata]|nr:hypothetical protein BDZ89DRAFT_250297 [Hymenopellis radicata]
MNIIGHASECLIALRIAYETLKVISFSNVTKLLPNTEYIQQCETENEVATILLCDLEDIWNFATAFITNSLGASTPHLYISALAIYDGESKLLHRWKKGFIGLPRLLGRRRREYLLTTIIKHNDAVISALFSHDGQHIISASSDKTVRMWNAETGKEELRLEGHTDWVLSASFSHDGQYCTLSTAFSHNASRGPVKRRSRYSIPHHGPQKLLVFA